MDNKNYVVDMDDMDNVGDTEEIFFPGLTDEEISMIEKMVDIAMLVVDFRCDNNLNSTLLAEKLGLSPALYRSMENGMFHMTNFTIPVKELHDSVYLDLAMKLDFIFNEL